MEMMAERGIAVDHSTVHRWCRQTTAYGFRTFRTTEIALRHGIRQVARSSGYPHFLLTNRDFRCARILLSSIEPMHMIAKGKMKGAGKLQPSAAQQLYLLAT